MPNQFLGPNIEHRTGNNLIQEERVSSQTWRTELEHRVNESWRLTLIGRYALRLYNDAFAERDTKFWTLGSQVEYAVNSRIALTLAYLYERGLAEGRGNTQFHDDVSYRLHAVSAGTDLTLIESLSLHLTYIYRRKDFTSELLGDTHLNRHDDSHQGMAEFRYRLTMRRASRRPSNGLSEPRRWRREISTTRSIPSGAAIVVETITLSPCRCVERGGSPA